MNWHKVEQNTNELKHVKEQLKSTRRLRELARGDDPILSDIVSSVWSSKQQPNVQFGSGINLLSSCLEAEGKFKYVLTESPEKATLVYLQTSQGLHPVGVQKKDGEETILATETYKDGLQHPTIRGSIVTAQYSSEPLNVPGEFNVAVASTMWARPSRMLSQNNDDDVDIRQLLKTADRTLQKYSSCQLNLF